MILCFVKDVVVTTCYISVCIDFICIYSDLSCSTKTTTGTLKTGDVCLLDLPFRTMLIAYFFVSPHQSIIPCLIG